MSTRVLAKASTPVRGAICTIGPFNSPSPTISQRIHIAKSWGSDWISPSACARRWMRIYVSRKNLREHITK